ncbi:hypothetical protein BGZ98_006780 [Dissophora globulifera]|nr:hypothetical protein BGZ98_006780 [Dissophora globulifera]
MKFIATLAVVASSMAALVSADMLQISNPTMGSVWTTGQAEFVGWSGNCASMGAAGKNVTVDLLTGPSSAVRYVATLGTLDCTGSNARADFTVSNSIAAGTYSIIVRTQPTGQESYTNQFQINNPSSAPSTPVAPVAPVSDPAPSTNSPTTKSSGASSLGANAVMAFAGAAAVAYQLL